jgi:hypothetical protein
MQRAARRELGTHEGIDYNVDNCTQIVLGTPSGPRAGRVIRADTITGITPQKLNGPCQPDD